MNKTAKVKGVPEFCILRGIFRQLEWYAGNRKPPKENDI